MPPDGQRRHAAWRIRACREPVQPGVADLGVRFRIVERLGNRHRGIDVRLRPRRGDLVKRACAGVEQRRCARTRRAAASSRRAATGRWFRRWTSSYPTPAPWATCCACSMRSWPRISRRAATSGGASPGWRSPGSPSTGRTPTRRSPPATVTTHGRPCAASASGFPGCTSIATRMPAPAAGRHRRPDRAADRDPCLRHRAVGGGQARPRGGGSRRSSRSTSPSSPTTRATGPAPRPSRAAGSCRRSTSTPNSSTSPCGPGTTSSRRTAIRGSPRWPRWTAS